MNLHLPPDAIPASWPSGMSELEYLNLSSNAWSAPLNGSWATAGSWWPASLKYLDLSNNSLSAVSGMAVDIPWAWSNLALRVLNVSGGPG